jgi:hypothetical protein
MAKNHILVGTGGDVDVPQSVINESLRDVLSEGDTLIMPWHGKPNDATRMVYDYVFDQGIQFVLVNATEGGVAKAFSASEHGVVVSPQRGLAQAYVDEYIRDTGDGRGAFIVLGNDPKTDEEIMDVYSRMDIPPTVVDLGDGLTPVQIEGDDEAYSEPIGASEDDPQADEDEKEAVVEEADEVTEEADEVTEDDDPDPFSFNVDELRAMPVRVLKKLCAQVVPEDEMPKGNAKTPFIDAIEAARDALARELHGVQPVIFDTIEEALNYARLTIAKLQEDVPSRTTALVLTKIEEALLWYHYGDEIHGGK